METTLFHVFRNTPRGREILMQSLFFCKITGASILIYIPEHTKFLMYFENDVVQVDLDKSYLTDPDTAKKHAEELAEQAGIYPRFLHPKNFTASTLPDIPVNFDFMCCPRSITSLSSKISLGHIGPKVRRIINAAKFPVLIPAPQFKEWQNLTVFFGGSANSVKALKLGLHLSRVTGKPLDIFTQTGRKTKKYFEDILTDNKLDTEVEENVRQWYFFKKGDFKHNLYNVPHDALAVLGAYGHGLVKDVMFGNTMEIIQKTLPNTLLVAGPHYVIPPG